MVSQANAFSHIRNRKEDKIRHLPGENLCKSLEPCEGRSLALALRRNRKKMRRIQ